MDLLPNFTLLTYYFLYNMLLWNSNFFKQYIFVSVVGEKGLGFGKEWFDPER